MVIIHDILFQEQLLRPVHINTISISMLNKKSVFLCS
uniref:Uncharacterized protein n=1 Tax=Anguilla anguilla TaxID=7936 RepID=A0A0E9UK86_ANGAN